MVEGALCTSMTTRVKISRTKVKSFTLMHWPVTPALKGWGRAGGELAGCQPSSRFSGRSYLKEIR